MHSFGREISAVRLEPVLSPSNLSLPPKPMHATCETHARDGWRNGMECTKRAGLAIALWLFLVGMTAAGTLTPTESEGLRAEVAAITAAVERGDAEDLIKLTHPSLQNFVGGPDVFAQITRQSVSQIRESGVKFVASEVGTPTKIYLAAEEEVCFVPRTSVMEVQGKKIRSSTFMIAIRRTGHGEWKYLDGAGLREHPELLYQLLPNLERGISLPLNMIEAL